MSLPPLPIGWTLTRVLWTEPSEIASLPDREYRLISAHLRAQGERQLQAIRAGAHIPIDEDEAPRFVTSEQMDAEVATEWGLDLALARSTQRELFQVARHMKYMGYEVWGFAVLKAWGYRPEDQDRWNTFWTRFQQRSDARLRRMGAVGNLREGFAGRFQWLLVQDEERLIGTGTIGAKELWSEILEEQYDEENAEPGMIPYGVNSTHCVVVDEGVVASLLDGGNEPYVIGIAVNRMGPDEGVGDFRDADGNWSPGYYKIAMDALIPDLWETLVQMTHRPICPGIDRVYEGIVGDVFMPGASPIPPRRRLVR